jgi:hypothetical protein
VLNETMYYYTTWAPSITNQVEESARPIAVAVVAAVVAAGTSDANRQKKANNGADWSRNGRTAGSTSTVINLKCKKN